MDKKLSLGIDIGTTTLCMLLLDGENGELLETITQQNEAFIKGKASFEKLQDVSVIEAQVNDMLMGILKKYPVISCIGVTGQMHGIVYIDEKGQAVSPLYTWQDERGNLLYKNGLSYAAYLGEIAGYKLSTGFGAVTHFYNQANQLIPSTAKYLCTVMDYIAMRLAGEKAPLMHPSNAASIGAFDLKKNQFDLAALEKAGIDVSFFPKLLEDRAVHEKNKNGQIVAAAIGDNQASFIGSVKGGGLGLLVNIGTSSQVSVYTSCFEEVPGLETRPLINKSFILVGSPLCGGRAYALLEAFFREIAELVTEQELPKLYPLMARLTEGFSEITDPLEILPQFSGTREQPDLRGEIRNISTENFTAKHFAIGMLQGIAREVYDLYLAAKPYLKERPVRLIGSGNAVRMNKALQQMIFKLFDIPLCIPVHKEEASYGAALFALIEAGFFSTLEEAQKLIRYTCDLDQT